MFKNLISLSQFSDKLWTVLTSLVVYFHPDLLYPLSYYTIHVMYWCTPLYIILSVWYLNEITQPSDICYSRIYLAFGAKRVSLPIPSCTSTCVLLLGNRSQLLLLAVSSCWSSPSLQVLPGPCCSVFSHCMNSPHSIFSNLLLVVWLFMRVQIMPDERQECIVSNLLFHIYSEEII